MLAITLTRSPGRNNSCAKRSNPALLRRRYRSGAGTGKRRYLSGIACATLDGPLMVPRGETLVVASTFEQARIAFEHVVAFMGPRISNPVWRVWDTAQSGRVENRETGARVRVLGSDPRRAHGLAPCLILADEPAQWDPNKSDRMLAALRTAAGKQPSCKFVAIGTKPAQDEHWFSPDAHGRGGPCAVPCGGRRRQPLRAQDLAQGQPVTCPNARFT